METTQIIGERKINMIEEAIMLLSLLLPNSSNVTQHAIVPADDYDTYVPDSSTFTRIGGSDIHSVLECEDGYVYDQIDIYKHPFTESSDLYLYKVTAAFTPGVVANANGTKMKDGKTFAYSYLYSGFMHVCVYKYQYLEYGGDITYKAIAPLSSTTTTTVTSTYGKNMTSSFSAQAGVSVDTMGVIKANLGVSSSTSIGISYSNSVSTTSEDPVLSTQYAKNQTNGKTEAQWSFSVINGRGAGEKTYWMTTYLLFEMSNAVSYFNRDVFMSYIHFGFRGQYYYYKQSRYDTYLVWTPKSTTYTGADGATNFA